MSAGSVGQDEMIEILENLLKMMSSKRAIEKRRKEKSSDLNKRSNQKDSLEKLDSGTVLKGIGSKKENGTVLTKDRLSKEEALTYLQAYSGDVDLNKYEFKSNFLDDKRVSLNFVEKTNNSSPERFSIAFDLEKNKGTIEHSFYGESKGSFETVTNIEKRFSKDEMIQKYAELSSNERRKSIKNNLSEKVSLVDSMTSYAETLALEGYNLSSKSIIENKAKIFFKHKERPGDVKELSYDVESGTGRVTHLVSNKANNYSNQKEVVHEFKKTDLERHGFGKTQEQIALENERRRLDTVDTRDDREIEYNQKVLDSKLGKSVTKQVLANPELLKGAIALYQLTSMRKLLANSKDQIENLNSLLNKKDANYEKIQAIKDGLSKQIDVLQEKVSALESNQETAQTFENLNEGYKKDQDEEYEKSIENRPVRVVEVDHTL